MTLLPLQERLMSYAIAQCTAGTPSSMRMSSMWAGLTLGATAGFIMAYQNSAGDSQRYKSDICPVKGPHSTTLLNRICHPEESHPERATAWGDTSLKVGLSSC